MKTILHIIDSLSIGGAETLLVNANVMLPSYKHVIVHLKEPNVYQDILQDIPVFCLDFHNWSSLPKTVIKLRKLIRQHNVQIVHSHLYYSTIIARLGLPCSARIPLISSYHSLLYDSKNTAQYSSKLLLLDRLTYRERYHLLFVSKAVQSMICKKVEASKNHEVLYNFVDDPYFSIKNTKRFTKSSPFRLVMLGNLRSEKNYYMVIKALSALPSKWFSLDIYGDGQQRKELQDMVSLHKLEKIINLKGRITQPYIVLPDYDLYIAASRFEGFGIALAEAMASGLPCLVSDIAAHREVAGDTVIYFDPERTESLAEKISSLMNNPITLEKMKHQSRQRAELFSKSAYMERLAAVYNKLSSDG